METHKLSMQPVLDDRFVHGVTSRKRVEGTARQHAEEHDAARPQVDLSIGKEAEEDGMYLG